MSRWFISAQRRERIREYLQTHRVLRSADLCEMLGVSEATIRRDLEWLENQGIIERTHGSVTVVADHSKWGVVSSFEVATIDQIHRLITDRGLNPRARAELVARSVEVIIAPTEPDLDSRDRPRD